MEAGSQGGTGRRTGKRSEGRQLQQEMSGLSVEVPGEPLLKHGHVLFGSWLAGMA